MENRWTLIVFFSHESDLARAITSLKSPEETFSFVLKVFHRNAVHFLRISNFSPIRKALIKKKLRFKFRGMCTAIVVVLSLDVAFIFVS